MKLAVIIGLFIAYLISTNHKAVDGNPVGNTEPLKVYHRTNGQIVYCRVRRKKDECWFDNEIAACDRNGTMVKCVPCKPGYRNCIRPSSDLDVKCYRPELDCQPEEISIVNDLADGGCRTECQCNRTAGYVRRGDECVKHPTPCGVNSTLFNGKCTGCPSGTYKPWEGFQDCIPLPNTAKPSLSVSASPRQEASGSTPKPVTEKGDDVLFPPTLISATPLSSSQVYLQWNCTGPVAKYTVFLNASDSGSAEPAMLECNGDVLTATVTDLQPATVYVANVVATNSDGATSSSNIIQVTTKNLGENEDTTSNAGWPWPQILAGVFGGVFGFVLVAWLLTKTVKLLTTKGPETIVNCQNAAVHFHNHGQNLILQQPNGPPPPYPRNTCQPLIESQVATSNITGENPHPVGEDQPELPSEMSCLLSPEPASERSSGPDTTTVKRVVSLQNDVHKIGTTQLSKKPIRPLSTSSQTYQKLPFPSQEAGATGGDDTSSEFGPCAMKGVQ